MNKKILFTFLRFLRLLEDQDCQLAAAFHPRHGKNVDMKSLYYIVEIF